MLKCFDQVQVIDPIFDFRYVPARQHFVHQCAAENPCRSGRVKWPW